MSREDSVPDDLSGEVDDLLGPSLLEDLHEDINAHAVSPLGPQATAELEADQYAAIWKEGSEYNVKFPAQLGPPPPALLADELRAAARTFPAGTGLGTENVAPRAFARLSTPLLQNFATLLYVCELTGFWPSCIALVMIALLPKSDGGRRPIGLFPTIVRIWMRTRTSAVRAWEAANTVHEIFGGASMGAHRAA